MWPENSQPDDLLCTFAASTFFYGSPMTIAIMHSLFGDSFSLSIINNPHWLLVVNDFVAIVLVQHEVRDSRSRSIPVMATQQCEGIVLAGEQRTLGRIGFLTLSLKRENYVDDQQDRYLRSTRNSPGEHDVCSRG